MGLVYLTNKGLITPWKEETITWGKALIEAGKAEAEVKVAPLSAEEVDMILLKLDQLAMSTQHEGIAKMVAEEAESILIAIRMVKAETKSKFQGILGSGSNLDICWIRPRMVGDDNLFNSADADNMFLYGGASAVNTWLQTFTADTEDDLIPEQKMVEEAAVIHLGAIDPVEVPKLESIRFTLAGIPAPAQSLPFNIRQGFSNYSLPFIRFEKPVIVGPEATQLIYVYPNLTGDSKFQLLSLVIAKAQTLTLTLD